MREVHESENDGMMTEALVAGAKGGALWLGATIGGLMLGDKYSPLIRNRLNYAGRAFVLSSMAISGCYIWAEDAVLRYGRQRDMERVLASRYSQAGQAVPEYEALKQEATAEIQAQDTAFRRHREGITLDEQGNEVHLTPLQWAVKHRMAIGLGTWGAIMAGSLLKSFSQKGPLSFKLIHSRIYAQVGVIGLVVVMSLAAAIPDAQPPQRPRPSYLE
ncbi:hypothetical protein H696_04943 [Fonticula alba]|uniref:HIG1 domain-containing protein n=1 Tax=Fonticula alba TaxID=691883 RepID=A0A058Z555_FONAL|nr:hypothetical protein H696_04943 [Fonticula alba]KCV68652.1 hypothetical protein H696_04943 [Fonticula alba]|eukprot:XP_009497084.1 hypothetical protein H696_04943 [Fonticula alba]